MKQKLKIAVVIILSFALLNAIVFGVYAGDYYRAEEGAKDFLKSTDEITVTNEGKAIVFSPKDPTYLFVFYPGGKVEYTAYAPLMYACAEKGALCILVRMPVNLAVFDFKAASRYADRYPELKNRFIGGHSLGGAMASGYLSSHTDEYKGLVLLGSYSSFDLSASSLSVLSVYGSEDRIMDRERYQKNLANMPSDFSEIVLEGGCHANFGWYGIHKGDGVPSLTKEEQIEKTASIIAEFFQSKTV